MVAVMTAQPELHCPIAEASGWLGGANSARGGPSPEVYSRPDPFGNSWPGEPSGPKLRSSNSRSEARRPKMRELRRHSSATTRATPVRALERVTFWDMSLRWTPNTNLIPRCIARRAERFDMHRRQRALSARKLHRLPAVVVCGHAANRFLGIRPAFNGWPGIALARRDESRHGNREPSRLLNSGRSPNSEIKTRAKRPIIRRR